MQLSVEKDQIIRWTIYPVFSIICAPTLIEALSRITISILHIFFYSFLLIIFIFSNENIQIEYIVLYYIIALILSYIITYMSGIFKIKC